MKNVLHVENVTMQFGGVVAVNNLSMDVNEGEIVALIGPNGAGKTTAFNCITGVYEPTNGRVDFMGETIAENFPTGRMKRTYAGENAGMYTKRVVNTPDKITSLGIARTFQNIRLFKALTVLDNVLIAQHLRLTASWPAAVLRTPRYRRENEQMHRRAEELLTYMGLWDVRGEIASSLPYGMQRKLEIARALATQPVLLLLDEPAAGMNPSESEELTELIRGIRDQFHLTVLLIEHHMDVVMDISDRIYVLNYGSLIAEGTPAEIQQNEDVIHAYLGGDDDEA